MIALRNLLGKTGSSSSCTYDNKCCGAVCAENERLRAVVLDLEARLVAALGRPAETEAKLQRALDETALQSMLIEQLEARVNAGAALFSTQPDYVLQQRVEQLECKLAHSEAQLARTVEAHGKAKAHITALQQQREQLVEELEQVEDGFQAEVDKLQSELVSWKRDCEPIQASHLCEASASLERTKAATRIWALEDEVERVRSERDALRRRLGAGRANLIQLKRKASQVRQLNTLVRPRIRGEPLTPETSDDSASLDMKM